MTDKLSERYNNFEDLPSHLKVQFRECLDSNELEEFVLRRIESFDNRSILELLNAEGKGGEKKILEAFSKLVGM